MRNVDSALRFHFLFTLLLLFEKFHLTSDVAP